MPGLDWQSLIVYITIGASLWHLVRVFRHPLGDEGKGCGSCGANPAAHDGLLQIETADH